MDSSTISILCNEFSCLSVEAQNEEIGKLFVLVGGIRITRNRGEVSEEFRHRTFEKGLKNLSDDSGYEAEFFEERIIPSLIEDFKESSVDTQERLLYKLSELTDDASIKRKSGESDRRFRVRSYSQLLRKIPDGYEFEMVEFARQIGESEDESDENQYDEEDESDEYDDESTSARSRGHKSYSTKGDSRRRYYSDSDGGSVSAEECGGATEPARVGAWNDGSKKAGFNPQLKLKAKSKPNPARTSNPKSSRSRIPISY